MVTLNGLGERVKPCTGSSQIWTPDWRRTSNLWKMFARVRNIKDLPSSSPRHLRLPTWVVKSSSYSCVVVSHLEGKYFVFLAEISLAVQEPGRPEDLRLFPELAVPVDRPVEGQDHGPGPQLPPSPANLHGGENTVRDSLRGHRPQPLDLWGQQRAKITSHWPLTTDHHPPPGTHPVWRL